MKWVVNLVGAVVAFVGAFWVLQGINVIPVGIMAGQPQYAVLGVVVVLLGIGLIVFANRRDAGAGTKRGGPSGPSSGAI